MSIRDLLEEQIIADAITGDTTVLAELLEMLDYQTIYNALSDENQQKAQEPMYICNNCHGHFPKDEMKFDVNDSDLCLQCCPE
jgi:hypothetical protein